MPIRVDVHTAQGIARGTVSATGHLRDILEAGGQLHVARATWQPFGIEAPRAVGDLAIDVDDILVAIGDDDPTIPIHASWHRIQLDVPPYRLVGELPTLPGYDPGRALTRPTGTFVVLRDIEAEALERPGQPWPLAHVALVNRYAVERVAADLMLGFFFPGAALDEIEAAPV